MWRTLPRATPITAASARSTKLLVTSPAVAVAAAAVLAVAVAAAVAAAVVVVVMVVMDWAV